MHSQNAITLGQGVPPGAMLVRDAQGQLMMVQGQVPPPTSSPAPASQAVRVQSVRVPITQASFKWFKMSSEQFWLFD